MFYSMELKNNKIILPITLFRPLRTGRLGTQEGSGCAPNQWPRDSFRGATCGCTRASVHSDSWNPLPDPFVQLAESSASSAQSRAVYAAVEEVRLGGRKAGSPSPWRGRRPPEHRL